MKTGTDTIRPSSIVHRPSGGFTLVEMLVALAIVLILIGAAARLGQAVRTRAAARLTQSALAVIETALQQYHDDFGDFPFYSLDVDTNGWPNDYTVNELQIYIQLVTGAVSVVISNGILETPGYTPPQMINGASSAGLWWFLNRSANSRSIIDALTPSLITTFDAQTKQRLALTITPPAPAPAETTDLGRFIDSWGTSLWYRCEAGYSFPKLISAGPDKQFGTSDDIEN